MGIVKISLAAARVNAELTQKELAEKCGVSESTIINWENGKSLPNMRKLNALERALGISLDHVRFDKR